MKITFAGVFRKPKIIGDGRVRLTAVAFPGGAAASAEHIASGCASPRGAGEQLRAAAAFACRAWIRHVSGAKRSRATRRRDPFARGPNKETTP